MPCSNSKEETGSGDEREVDSIVVKFQNKLPDLSVKQDQVMAKINILTNGACMCICQESDRSSLPLVMQQLMSVDYFFEEVQRAIWNKGLNKYDQITLILSLLRGPALEEVKLCNDGDLIEPDDTFYFLPDAYREKHSVSQLLQTFYSCHQLEGIRDNSLERTFVN